MKIYPPEKDVQAGGKSTRSQHSVDSFMRVLALIVAFISVFVFFFKILFF